MTTHFACYLLVAGMKLKKWAEKKKKLSWKATLGQATETSSSNLCNETFQGMMAIFKYAKFNESAA